jgi:hypothetical protein
MLFQHITGNSSQQAQFTSSSRTHNLTGIRHREESTGVALQPSQLPMVSGDAVIP